MGSILRATDGVSKFEMPREGVVVITFDDRKTTVAKIVKAIEKGRFSVQGKPVYVKPGATLPPGSSPGPSSQSPQESSPGITVQSSQGLPIYNISPDM